MGTEIGNAPGPCLQGVLARQCGPVLLRAKPAVLFSLCTGDDQVPRAAALLAAHGVRLEALRLAGRRALVLCYRPDMLAAALGHPLAESTLAGLFYPVGGGLAALLGHLRRRIGQGEEFPHEIGFFLGYPAEDVLGFIQNGGRDFKHCCLWKVYGDVEHAKTLCSKYEACRKFCSRHIEIGGTLHSLSKVINKAG